MAYYHCNSTPSPIEALLDRVFVTNDQSSDQPTADSVSASKTNPGAGTGADSSAPPPLERFLEEEDILRECRADNKRLITYLCEPQIVKALVAHAVTSKSQCYERYSPPSTDQPLNDQQTPDSQSQQELPPIPSNPLKFPYVASELLSADIRELCDVVVADNTVMDLLFHCVEGNQPGHLEPFVATHFSKVIVSLLKTRNSQTLKQMRRRGKAFTDSLVKHIALGPISELIVRLLDAPEHERGYDTSVYPPSPGALLLLTNADLLNGLAEAFVQASHPLGDSESPAERRHREETLANVTTSITGLTERILQLPPLNVVIPEQLSAYHTPKAVTRLLDAGLFAVTSASTGSIVDQPQSPTAVSAITSSVVLSGNYSALLHSLSLAANLMTSKSNVWEDEKVNYDPHHSDSTHDGLENGDVDDREADEAETTGEERTGSSVGTGSLLRPRVAGDSIVSTSLLEQELVVRFQRLAQMFGTLEHEVSTKVPLGSLRLKLAEFFTACMKKASRTTVEHIIELGVPKKLLELFRCYEWSSMLHGVVTSSIMSALEAGMTGLPARIAWFDAQLVGWLLGTWSSNERKEADGDCRFRAGYMGHLIKIGAALRDYVGETEQTNKEALFQLMSEDNVTKFKTFAENSLAPAHRIEVTPLCDNDSESEEIYEEEPTDLLEMGVGEVIEGLTQGDPNVAIQRFSKFLLHKSGGNLELKEDEEEVTAVDVGDLSHFGDDDEEVEEVSPLDDHDLPPEMRRQLAADAAAAAGPDLRPNGRLKEATENEIAYSLAPIEDGDGTYASHVASKASAEATATADKIVQPLETLTLVDPTEDVVVPIPSPSLEVDAAVTEIDEPQPVTPVPQVSSLTREAASPGDNADDSSDEDLDNWVAFDEFAKQQGVNSPSGNKQSSNISELSDPKSSPPKQDTASAQDEASEPTPPAPDS